MAMPLEAISGSNAAPVPVSDDFQAIKCLELQNAIAQRAKEHGRELESLLLLKAPRIRDSLSPPLSPEDDFPPATFLSPRSNSDESGEHGLGLDLNNGPQSDMEPQILRDPKQEQEELLQLVAKMIFRRRDSPRPLTGRPIMSPPRKYVRSSLSQETLVASPSNCDVVEG